jgi:hypothetical protein
MLSAFPALQAELQDGDTLLRGALPDQSALHGVLAQIEALGLELLDLRRLPGGPQGLPPPYRSVHAQSQPQRPGPSLPRSASTTARRPRRS